MFNVGKPASGRILAVRLGAFGDIIHTLPAVASLKHSFPGWHITWAVEPQWAPLLEANPFVDEILPVRRDSLHGMAESWRAIRSSRYDFTIDFQGLIKSALVASCARTECIFGFDRARERTAGFFYSNKTASRSVHKVDQNLDLAVAAGAASIIRAFPIPAGRAEGRLPVGDFVLACPQAGWSGKQWPMDYYSQLAMILRRELDVPLVLNGPPAALAQFAQVADAIPHCSSLDGLIYATRCAAAVVGVDSGPLHLAAALGKPGVAIYGPTDPSINGPYGSSMRVLRSPEAGTTYKRSETIDESMARIRPPVVLEALRSVWANA
jgi:heptosyltransferase-1